MKKQTIKTIAAVFLITAGTTAVIYKAAPTSEEIKVRENARQERQRLQQEMELKILESQGLKNAEFFFDEVPKGTARIHPDFIFLKPVYDRAAANKGFKVCYNLSGELHSSDIQGKVNKAADRIRRANESARVLEIELFEPIEKKDGQIEFSDIGTSVLYTDMCPPEMGIRR
jgi:hypothetical protein